MKTKTHMEVIGLTGFFIVLLTLVIMLLTGCASKSPLQEAMGQRMAQEAVAPMMSIGPQPSTAFEAFYRP